jgi:hypothetical protein
VLPGLSGNSPVFVAIVVSTMVMFAVAIAFLVAAARLRRSNNRKSALWSRLEQSLGTTVDTIAHGSAGAEALHSRIRPAERVVLLDYLYKSVLSEPRESRRQLYRELARPYLGVLEQRARQGDVWQRARAIRTLVELAGQEADTVIIEALDAKEPHVAMTAARGYAQLGLGPVDPLLERIGRYQNWDRRMLRSVLVSFGTDAAPALHEKLADTSAPATARAVCADALAALDYRAAGDTAASVLREQRERLGPDARSRAGAEVDLVACCLRLLRRPASDEQRQVVRELCDSPDEVVRGQAIACLARIGDRLDLARVDRAIEDTSPWVVRSAVNGLAERGIDRSNELMARGTLTVPRGGE